jgi:hypothetical protein
MSCVSSAAFWNHSFRTASKTEGLKASRSAFGDMGDIVDDGRKARFVWAEILLSGLGLRRWKASDGGVSQKLEYRRVHVPRA